MRKIKNTHKQAKNHKQTKTKNGKTRKTEHKTINI